LNTIANVQSENHTTIIMEQKVISIKLKLKYKVIDANISH